MNVRFFQNRLDPAAERADPSDRLGICRNFRGEFLRQILLKSSENLDPFDGIDPEISFDILIESERFHGITGPIAHEFEEILSQGIPTEWRWSGGRLGRLRSGCRRGWGLRSGSHGRWFRRSDPGRRWRENG